MVDATPDLAGSFAGTLRQAIADRGLSLERLHAHLDQRGMSVSAATLSYWQSGRSVPVRRRSLEALPHLEDLLELDRGALSGTLPATQDRARRSEVRDLDAIWPEQAQTRVLEQLDTRWDAELDRLSAHDVLVFGPDRRQRSITVRQVLRARADGADRRVVMHCHDDPTAGTPHIHPVQGCRVGRVVDHAGGRVLGAELEFHEPLRRGQTVVVEYVVVYGSPGPLEQSYQRRLRLPMRQYLLEVAFDPAALPQHCESFGDDRVSRPLAVDAGDRVHLVESDGATGTVGIRWTWPLT